MTSHIDDAARPTHRREMSIFGSRTCYFWLNRLSIKKWHTFTLSNKRRATANYHPLLALGYTMQ
ncbi:MAG TPA: hypothetical protein P5526_17805, partial [Anaerolineae bacterium]|nr:hypothetical protein [Anaerolineae bacterium]